jgi:hypothetical protein
VKNYPIKSGVDMFRTVPIFILLGFNVIFAAKDDSIWLSILINNQKIGYSCIGRSAVNDTVITTAKNVMKFRRGTPSGDFNSILSATVFEDSKGKPLSFTSVYANNDAKRVTTAVFSDSGFVTLRQHSMAGEKKFKYTWPENALLFEGIRQKYESKAPVIGETQQFIEMDFSSIQMQKTTRKVIGKKSVDINGEVDSLYIVESTIEIGGASAKATSYVTDQWKTRKVESAPDGMSTSMIECQADSILVGMKDIDILNSTTIKAPRDIGDVRYSFKCKYTLQIPPTLKIPSSSEQKVKFLEHNLVEVQVEKINVNFSTLYPLMNTPADIQQYLQPTQYIECNDRKITSMAAHAVGNTKKVRTALRRISRYVRMYITPSGKVAYATAKEVVEQKAGDCSEYAILTTALCRAAKIPARVTSGICYHPGYQSFLFHVWTQVFIDGQWISIDPAMYKFDPGHIAVHHSVDGSPTIAISNFIGNIKIVSTKIGL